MSKNRGIIYTIVFIVFYLFFYQVNVIPWGCIDYPQFAIPEAQSLLCKIALPLKEFTLPPVLFILNSLQVSSYELWPLEIIIQATILTLLIISITELIIKKNKKIR